MSALLGLALVAAAPVTLTSVAYSADRPTIAVVGMHHQGFDVDQQARAIRLLVRAIEDTGDFEPLDADDVGLRIRGRERVIVEEGLLDVAIEKLYAGKGLYHQASPDGALPTLQAAVGDFLRAMPATNTVTALWEAWVYIGTCHLYASEPNPEAARVAFQNAAALLPQRPLNAALFPPNVVEAYERERTYLSLFPVRLEIDTDSPATVWVDGVEHGSAPVSVTGLVPGEHHVVARGQGTLGYAIVGVDVPEEQGGAPQSARPETIKDVKVSMRRPLLGQAADSRVGRSQQTSSLYHALANRSADIDYVLMVGVDATTLFLQLLDARTEALSKTLELDRMDALDPALHAVEELPRLLELIGDGARLTATIGAAAPLDVGANSQLALLLLQPTDYVLDPPRASLKRRRRNRVIGVVTGFVLAGAGATAGFVYLANQNN